MTSRLEQLLPLVPAWESQQLCKDLLEFVAAHSPCSCKELHRMFADVPRTVASDRRFHNMLRRLRMEGLLCRLATSSRREPAYVLGNGSATLAPPTPRPRPTPAATPEVRVPPRQVDVMHGPLYRSGASFVMRPGAQDFLGWPSRGTRC